MTDLTIELDLMRCQGYANCVAAAPELFDVDEETGLAVLREAAPSAEQLDAALEAERVCPAGAIAVDRPS